MQDQRRSNEDERWWELTVTHCYGASCIAFRTDVKKHLSAPLGMLLSEELLQPRLSCFAQLLKVVCSVSDYCFFAPLRKPTCSWSIQIHGAYHHFGIGLSLSVEILFDEYCWTKYDPLDIFHYYSSNNNLNQSTNAKYCHWLIGLFDETGSPKVKMIGQEHDKCRPKKKTREKVKRQKLTKEKVSQLSIFAFWPFKRRESRES